MSQKSVLRRPPLVPGPSSSQPRRVQVYHQQEEEACPIKTITIEVPDEMTSLGGGSDEELAGAMRLATAILWYQQGRISQGKAAEIAGINRVLFLNALHDAGVDATQITEEELGAKSSCRFVRIVNSSK